MTKRLREIIKNIKNWQFDLSDSLIQLFSTRLCTSQDLDINFDANRSLSVEGDLINWFDDYSWKTNRPHLTPHMFASFFSLVESVCLNFCLFRRRLQWDTWLLLWVTACLHGLFVYCSWYIFVQLQHFIYVLVGSLKWFTPLMEVFFMSYSCISSCRQNHFENYLTKCIQYWECNTHISTH